MLGKLVRYLRAGDLPFVTFRCYRVAIAGHRHHARALEQSPEAMRGRCDFYVSGYVVMPEHEETGGPTRTRTWNQSIMSALL
jgi:hypothetical protein